MSTVRIKCSEIQVNYYA